MYLIIIKFSCFLLNFRFNLIRDMRDFNLQFKFVPVPNFEIKFLPEFVLNQNESYVLSATLVWFLNCILSERIFHLL